MCPTPASPSRAEPVDLASLAGLKLGNYRLEQLVGRGRMGVVYRANDEALLRPTAVKVLSWAVAEAAGQDPVQWFLSEARIVARINHPQVVQIYGVARAGDLCYIAMEYVAGESAEALVARAGPMAPEGATEVLLHAAAALQAAHASGVVHRDVKPGNLLVGPGLVTKLGDFGIALGPPGVRIGNARLRVGTPHYTAPEIWRGDPASPASDLYALGATYYQLLTGRPPFPGPDGPAVEQGHLRTPVPDPRALRPEVPAACAALAMRALAKAPGERPASAAELIEEGRRLLEDLRPGAARGPQPERAPSRTPARGPAGPLPCAELEKAFAFVRRPFFDADPASPPYRGEPFVAVQHAVLARLSDERAPAVALTGPPGSGRTVLGRGLAAALAPSRLTLALDLAAGGGGRLLVHRLRRAAGAVDASAHGTLAALVDRLGQERRLRGQPSLVVLDGVPPNAPAGSELGGLLEAARATGAFQVLLLGQPGLGEALAPVGGGPIPEVAIPPLPAGRIGVYLETWLAAARPPAPPAIVISPDARLLVALRSEGLPGRIDVLAENMLLLAAAARSRTLSSWHAWAASDRERWAGREASALPRRPAVWPPPEVVAVIDACRRGAGFPPWPRGGP